MGEWEVYIGKYDRRNIPEPLTETVTIDAKGEAFIKMPMEVIGEESGIWPAQWSDHRLRKARRRPLRRLRDRTRVWPWR